MSDYRSSEQAPWIPLAGLMQQWAGLALDAEALHTAEMTVAISQALAALAHEQSALSKHHLALSCGHAVLFDYDPIMQQLEHASTAWSSVVYALDRHLCLHRVAPERAAPLRACLLDALHARQRLWRIGACLLAEQERRYQQEVPHA